MRGAENRLQGMLVGMKGRFDDRPAKELNWQVIANGEVTQWRRSAGKN